LDQVWQTWFRLDVSGTRVLYPVEFLNDGSIKTTNELGVVLKSGELDNISIGEMIVDASGNFTHYRFHGNPTALHNPMPLEDWLKIASHISGVR
jgi:hypothetical protein